MSVMSPELVPAIHATAWIIEVRVIEEIERLNRRLEVQSLG